MKKIYRHIGIIGICIISFYYTNMVALFVKSKNPIYQEILSNNKEIKSIDSIIDSNYIIPGLNGKKINIDESFSNMHKINNYDESLLVYDEITPKVSLEDNKDKIIKRGNSKKNQVSLIFDKESILTKYLLDNNYNINLLIDKEEYNKSMELINNSNIESTYNKIDKYLDKKKINKKLCYVNSNINTLCKNKYLFNTSLIINHTNISTTINQITNGEIIKIENSITKEELQLILQQIKFKKLDVVFLSKLISETN